jgi:small subunit ribosomal protein S7
MLLNRTKKKVIINKFINLLMVNGKKYKAEKIFFDLLKLIKIQNKRSYVILLFKALKIISPLVIVRLIRIKGRTFQVPIPLSEYKQLNIGMKWLVKKCKSEKILKNNPLSFILLQQINLIFKKKGELIKKKIELHKLAQANRLFANYRWF